MTNAAPQPDESAPSAPEPPLKTTIIYHDDTGAIRRVVSCPTSQVAAQPILNGMTAVLIAGSPPGDPAFIQNHYILNGLPVARGTFDISVSKTTLKADGADEVTISGIPAGAVAKISGVVAAGPETVTDGELIITTIQPGQINVSIQLRPTHQDFRVTINAS
jgi:hypothetical protein